MRFKKGNKVEVFNSMEVPYGYWQPAEIISGNGHTYSVRYECSSCAKGELIEERVSRKKLRPRPQFMNVEKWEAGELVEVFDDFSWKVASVLRGIDGDNYLVKQIGARRDSLVHKVFIRARKFWQDDKWFVIGQVSGLTKSSRPSGSDGYQKLQSDSMLDKLPGDYSSALHNNTAQQESSAFSKRFLKRAYPYDSLGYAESCIGNTRKIRSIEKGAQRQWYLSSPGKKVDAVAYPQKLGKTHMHDSYNNHANDYCEMGRVKINFTYEGTCAGKSEANGDDSDASSVGSCSIISNDEVKIQNRNLDGSSLCADSLSSDAESFCDPGDDEKLNNFLGEDGGTIHRSDLDSYRSTLETLFSSGPLSWEQEASLTNLRQSLNISDDEHLTELRKLMSSRTTNIVSWAISGVFHAFLSKVLKLGFWKCSLGMHVSAK